MTGICPCGQITGYEWDHSSDCLLWPGTEYERDNNPDFIEPTEWELALVEWAWGQAYEAYQ